MPEFAADYFSSVYISALGTLIIVTSYYKLSGLMIFGRSISIMLGISLILVESYWFFASKYRNVSDTAGGLDGNEQTFLFVIAAFAAIFSLLLISSLSNWSMKSESKLTGLDRLRNSNYIYLLLSLWRRK
tara:strand:- start:3596 stop:3985 length:390 start_codon:yes stop_codon:yes gene_type:complete